MEDRSKIFIREPMWRMKKSSRLRGQNVNGSYFIDNTTL